MTAPVIQNGLVGVVEDRFGLEIEDRLVEHVPRALAGTDLDIAVGLDTFGGELLAAPDEHGRGDVVTGRREIGESRLYDRWIVLAVDDDQVSDEGSYSFPPRTRCAEALLVLRNPGGPARKLRYRPPRP
ncbi:MAG: hypothetical protein ACRDKT_16240, partial [Actinomycetota bacterium]